jgi:hypothetical protein
LGAHEGREPYPHEREAATGEAVTNLLRCVLDHLIAVPGVRATAADEEHDAVHPDCGQRGEGERPCSSVAPIRKGAAHDGDGERACEDRP